MELKCKKCGSEAYNKNGFMKGKQRYKCKVCGINFTEGDKRDKHHESVKQAALALYLEGCGFRRISRLLKKILNVNVCYQLVIHWIKTSAKNIKDNTETPKTKIPLLELDELYTYVKKRQNRSEYGLLLIEMGYVLLDLKSGMQVQKPSESFGTM
jgi:transposase-like protein